MAVEFTNVYNLQDGLWLYEWTSDLVDPVYRVFIDGVLIAEQTDNTITVASRSVIEVLDDPTQEPQDAFPPYFVLGFETDEDAEEYIIEQYIASVWTELATLPNNAQWLQYETTGTLLDLTEYQFRIVPVDSAGNRGTEKEFTRRMIRHPDVPSATFTYDNATQVLTIS